MIFFFIFLYLAFGFFAMALYSMFNELDLPFSDKNNKYEENCKQFIIWVAWPFYVFYIVAKAVIWFFKYLFISIKFFWDKYIPKRTKKEND